MALTLRKFSDHLSGQRCTPYTAVIYKDHPFGQLTVTRRTTSFAPPTVRFTLTCVKCAEMSDSAARKSPLDPWVRNKPLFSSLSRTASYLPAPLGLTVTGKPEPDCQSFFLLRSSISAARAVAAAALRCFLASGCSAGGSIAARTICAGAGAAAGAALAGIGGMSECIVSSSCSAGCCTARCDRISFCAV